MNDGLDKKSAFLGLCLLDALEDENLQVCKLLITKYKADPNQLVLNKGISALHYACGMENIEIAEEAVNYMMDHGGDPNVRSDDNMTPLHVAAIWGRTNIFKKLLKHGGDLNVVDDDQKTPILYAIYESQFEVVKIIQNHVFEQKIERKKSLLISANTINSMNQKSLLAVKNLDEIKLTPNRINYNFDVTSPYYINITHRRKDKTSNSESTLMNSNQTISPPYNPFSDASSRKENLFELTEANVQKYAEIHTDFRSPKSVIHSWRERVQRSKSQRSILKTFNDIDALLSGILTDESMDFTNTKLNLDGSSESEKKSVRKTFANTSFGKLLERLKNPNASPEISFITANDNFLENNPEPLSESNFIKSPKKDEYIFQMTEQYVHTDDENGVVFYEKRILANPTEQRSDTKAAKTALNKSLTSVSSVGTVPLDYDTETLRAELTNFGEPPGPITKSTKRLYMKRLMKFKKHPETVNEFLNVENSNQPMFSVELERTFRKKEWFDRIPEFMKLEAEMCSNFQSNSNAQQRTKWREGNLKTSFIYLLIDPRISENLPGQGVSMDMHTIWKRFLSSIFYVGKGKSSRPYSHLYDAMKQFSRYNRNNNPEDKQNQLNEKWDNRINLQKPGKQITDSKKLFRILDIWQADKGVVCLHVFHNILPVEAYTREAAIIESMGLQHLTNLKRGDYYGPALTWTMRERKQLGVALLFKALQIFLAEGESQLMPSDLIAADS